MKPYCHPSERELGSIPVQTAGRFIARGQRCHCFSDSKSTTSTATNDYQAAAQGQARISTGTENRMATDQAVQLTQNQGDTAVNSGSLVKAGQDIVTGPKLGNVGAGATVNVTTDATGLAQLFSQQVADITQQAGQLLGQVITQNSDLTKSSAQNFTDATQGLKAGLSQSTISLLALGAVGVVGLYIWKRK